MNYKITLNLNQNNEKIKSYKLSEGEYTLGSDKKSCQIVIKDE